MIKPDSSIIKEIEEQRPDYPVGLLSKLEKDTLIERGVVGLYRWYLALSQARRNWNPDKSFDWLKLRTDHSEPFHRVIEGFFAVEQYVPDYTSTTIRQTRRSHGRSHFQIRWGAEEERHADLWYNALLFLRQRAPQWIRDYMHSLRGHEWSLRWEDNLHILSYVVIQERATQVNYLQTALVARGKGNKPEMAGDTDPIMAEAAQTIAIDEAAHYNFFLEIFRLYLYYYPAQTLEALADIVRDFAMPANQFIPDFQSFADALVKTGIYGGREYAYDVLQVVFDNIGIAGRKALEAGVRRSRMTPDGDGNMRETSFFDGFDYHAVESAVTKMFGKVEQHEQEIGFALIDPTRFIPSGMGKLTLATVAE